MTLGEKIAALRKERQWSQLKLSQLLGFEGRSPSITRWESNRCRPTSDTLRRLADLFEVSVDELLGGDPTSQAVVVKDHVLAEKMQQLQELDPDDRAVIYHIIETYAAQRRVAKAATTPKPRLDELRQSAAVR